MKFLNDPYKIKRLHILPATFFVAIIGLTAYSFRQIPRHDELAAQTTRAVSRPLPADLLPVEKVKSLAKAERRGSTVASIELGTHNGQLIYLVTLDSGTKLAFDAQTGDQLSDVTFTDTQATNDPPADLAPEINFARAQELALAARPDGVIDRLELAHEANTAIYRAYFTDGGRVDIAASNGTVVRIEKGTENADPSPSTTNGTPDNTSSSDAITPNTSDAADQDNETANASNEDSVENDPSF